MRHLFGLSLIVLLASPASPCSMARISLPGALASDGSVVFAGGSSDEERPGLEELAFYSASGVWQRSVSLELQAPDAFVQPLAVDAEDRVWLDVRCYGYEGRDCNQVLRVSPQGEILERLPVPEGERLWSDGERVFMGHYGRGGWTSHPVGEKPGDSSTHFKRPEGLCVGCENARWQLGEDGSALYAVESETEVHLVRFDAEGEEVYRRNYPLATWSQPTSEDDIRLGPVGALYLGPGGRAYFGQYAFDAGCSFYQPSSLAIFDESGELVRVAPTPGAVASILELPRELVVLLENGLVLRLGLDGTEIEEWRPDFGIWRGLPIDPDEMSAAAEAIDRSATPAEWVRVYPWSHGTKREQIEAWLAEAGAGVFELLNDDLFQQIGSALCQSHGEVAGAEALRRFERSLGRKKDAWLTVLSGCFADAPPTAYQYAVSRKEESDSLEAREALIAWGPPSEMIEGLWQKAKGEREVAAAKELVRLFPSQFEAFDQRLRFGSDEERRLVRQLLLETAGLWHGPNAYQVGPHDALLEAARGWQEAADPFVSATGRLMRLGHGDLGAKEALRDVIRHAVDDPTLTPWVGEALGIAEGRADDLSDDLSTWPDGAVEALIELGLSVSKTRYRLSWGEASAFRWLWHSGHRPVVRALVEKSRGGRTAGAARSRLVEVATAKPWFFEPGDLQSLIDAEWMLSSNRRTWSARRTFFEALGDAVHGLDTPLAAAVHQRYRDLYMALARDAAAQGRAGRFVGSTWNGMVRLLPELLSPEDVTELVSLSQEGLPAWLAMAVEVGVEPGLTGELESLLESRDTNTRVQAAAALGPMGHGGALEVLKGEGLSGGFSLPPEVFAPYAEDLREHLETEAVDAGLSRRSAALRALRGVGPSKPTLEKLATAAEATFAAGRLPDIEVLWLLVEHEGKSETTIFPKMLEVLKSKPEAGWSLHGRRDFALVFRDWLEADPRRAEAAGDLESYDVGFSRAALRWRKYVRQVAQRESAEATGQTQH